MSGAWLQSHYPNSKLQFCPASVLGAIGIDGPASASLTKSEQSFDKWQLTLSINC